jgi:hypothetical protein
MRAAALILLSFAAILTAQSLPPVIHSYSAYKSTSLSSAVETITVQQPASAARRVSLKAASVYCSADCVVTFKRGGTAATATTLVPLKLSSSYPVPTAVAFSGSDVGSGTTLFSFAITGGNAQAFDLTGIDFLVSGATENFSIATNSITATVRIQITWIETGATR